MAYEKLKKPTTTTNESLVLDMDQMVMSETLSLSEDTAQWRQSIYRVPKWVKEMSSNRSKAYQPQVVSLGPLHHREAELQPVEAHKLRAVQNLAARSSKTKEQFAAAVSRVAPFLESAYGPDLDEKWRGERNRGKFVEMMVRDGCFFLEVMRLNEAMDGDRKSVGTDFDPNDPVFSKHGFIYLFRPIQTDMLLMENQLPLLLLKTLASVANQLGDGCHATEMNKKVLHCLWRPTPPTSTNTPDGINSCLGLHPLDLYHKSYCGVSQKQILGPTQMRKPVMPSAMEMYEAGIQFKATDLNAPCHPERGIRFHGGVLSIPAYTMDSFSEKLLLNLMAFERLHAGAGESVTAYVVFMDNIIDTAQDVALLRAKGVLASELGSDEETADLINNRLSKGAAMSLSGMLTQVHEDVGAHCRKRRNIWRASLIHTYFRNPWVFTSLVAAFILLVATLLQTIYTIVSFHRQD
uniref:Uncharacterized protein n=1 Tax=Oryza rufipogon TaxID=4529 RepID=A0A0E0R9E7_ORYRU